MKIDSIELRNVKIHDDMSEETTAYTGRVYVNGKLVGESKNDGQGGPDQIRVSDRVVWNAIVEHARAAYPDKDEHWAVENLFADLLEAFQRKHEDERLARHERRQLAKMRTKGATHVVRLVYDGARMWMGARTSDAASRYLDEAIVGTREEFKANGPLLSWAVLDVADGKVLREGKVEHPHAWTKERARAERAIAIGWKNEGTWGPCMVGLADSRWVNYQDHPTVKNLNGTPAPLWKTRTEAVEIAKRLGLPFEEH